MRHEGGFPLLCLVEVVLPPHSLLLPVQGDGQKPTASGAGGWWKNSQPATGFYVFTWSGCGCWLRKHLTAQASNTLPAWYAFAFPQDELDLLKKDLWDGVSRGHVVRNTTIPRFWSYYNHNDLFCAWLITTGKEGSSLHQPESPFYTYLLVEIYDNSYAILSGQKAHRHIHLLQKRYHIFTISKQYLIKD